MAKKQFEITSRSEFDYTERDLTGKLRDAENELEALRSSHALFDDRPRFYRETARVSGRIYTYRTQLADLWENHGHWTKVDASTQGFAEWKAEQDMAREREANRTTDEDVKAREERDAIGLAKVEADKQAAAVNDVITQRVKELRAYDKPTLLRMFGQMVRIHSLTQRDGKTEIIYAIIDAERGSLEGSALRRLHESEKIVAEWREELGA